MISFAPRLEVRPLRRAAVPVLSALAAAALWSVLVLAHGKDPLRAARVAFVAVAGSNFGWSEAVVRAIPLALTSAGIALAASMRLFNIGAEGQLALGALAATGVAFALPAAPAALLVPSVLAAGAAAGALWGGATGVLRARFGTSEILTTLMLNYVAAYVVASLVFGPWRGPDNFPYTEFVPAAAWLSPLGPGRLHAGLFVALGAVLALAAWLRWSVWGFEVRLAGESWVAARYAGIRLGPRVASVMALSGAMAGLAGAVEIAGIQHRLSPQVSAGTGYTAIAVCWLARRSLLGSLAVSFLFGALSVAGDELQIVLSIPAATVRLFEAMLLLSFLAGDVLVTHRIVLHR